MSLSFPLHAPTPYFAVRDGHLVVADRTVDELAQAVGRTPFYVYDRAVMTRKVQELRAVLPREIEVHYAMKANPMPAVVKHFAGIVDGIDLASAAEMDVAIAAGMAPGLLSFAGPGKRLEELERAVAAGVVINMESFREMQRIAEIARRTGTRPKVAVRVNPDFELKNSGMKMAGGPKQFGVDAEQVPQLLQELRDLPLEFWGFHIYSGSQNLRPEVLVDAQRKTAALAIELSRHAPSPVRSLNLGGGLGIPYFPGEKPLDLAPIGANLHELLPEIRQALPEASVALELGRFLVGEAGVYVCRVIDRKVSRGQVFLVTDGGLHHHLAASGNFGQVIRKNYPVAIANRMGATDTETASVVGPLCTPLDLLGDRMELPVADVGDFVAVFQSGAYGYTASPLGFLSHPHPAQVTV
jgi:pyridoxal-dependent decarboxylase, exosortase system type 1 associated